MCTANLWPAVACLIACFVFAAVLVRWDEWRETNRRRDLMDKFLTRLEQSQHTWRESPAVDVERRG